MALTSEQKQQLIARTAASVSEEETLAAAHEIERKRAEKNAVVPVRLGAKLYAEVQSIAAEQRLPVSVVIRQWIAHGAAEAHNRVDVATELDALR